MKTEKFRYLAGVVAAHKGRQIVGRTRLQKTVKLLQRVGLPTNYDYVLFFYGPYSEGVKSDLGLLEVLRLVDEEPNLSADGTIYYTIEAKPEADLPQIDPFKGQIKIMEDASAVALELAATYDSFRETGSDHDTALQRLHRKKPEKCSAANISEALSLLQKLGLPHK